MNIPKCINNKNHQWKKGKEKYHETGICARCAYDKFDKCYRR